MPSDQEQPQRKQYELITLQNQDQRTLSSEIQKPPAKELKTNSSQTFERSVIKRKITPLKTTTNPS